MEEKPRPRRLLTWLGVGFLLILVAYPLSMGPVYYWIIDNPPGWGWVWKIYLPLDWLGKVFPRLEEWSYWYVSWWTQPTGKCPT